MGKIQKSFGDMFEEVFHLTCRRVPGMAITRFPDGCKVVGTNQIVRVKTPCDWILTYGGVTAMLDTKTTETDSFPFSKISSHQVSEMFKHSMAGGCSGYVIWFRKTDDVVFVNSLFLMGLIGKVGSIRTTQDHSNYLGKLEDFKAEMIFGKIN